ncbi:hypothetical protein A0H81_13611 [Grifola frondosa]|uniref:Uncharacterized protein n=1 Tax=Grifola frondosa TaxID=5627 RepID=A0A1C7LNN7_GRIFR|nr:hypothetical protein A0H81_13611 [Grifola frondosa]
MAPQARMLFLPTTFMSQGGCQYRICNLTTNHNLCWSSPIEVEQTEIIQDDAVEGNLQWAAMPVDNITNLFTIRSEDTGLYAGFSEPASALTVGTPSIVQVVEASAAQFYLEDAPPSLPPGGIHFMGQAYKVKEKNSGRYVIPDFRVEGFTRRIVLGGLNADKATAWTFTMTLPIG